MQVLLFRSTKATLDKCCRGFMKDDRHLANHFTYTTGSPPLNDNIKANLAGHISMHFEIF